jgi:hypothetical protein
MERGRAGTGTLAPIDPVETERGAYLLLIPPDPSPFTIDADSIGVAGFSAVIDNGTTVDFPAEEITGLTAETTYGVFYEIASESYLIALPPATAEMASDDYVFLGWFATTA